MKCTEEMKGIVKGKLLVTLTAFGNTNNGRSPDTTVKSSSLIFGNDKIIHIMKKILFFTVLSLDLILFSNSYSQSGWYWQDPYPTGEYLYSQSFINEQTGIAVGSSSTIIKTTDGGMKWKSISPTNFVMTYYSVFFVNENTGFVCGSESYILKTTNQGATWKSFDTETPYFNNSIFFINENTGWIAGSMGKTLKTTNGGINWQSNVLNYSTNLSSIRFLNAQTGWTVGYIYGLQTTHALVRKTTDGGATWFQQFIDTENESNNRVVYFRDSSKIWTAGNYGKVFYSTNGGADWIRQNSFSASYLFDIYFKDNNTGWISGGSGNIFKTVNGGNNWNEYSIGENMTLYKLSFSSNGNAFACGQNGTILRSTDEGNTWNKLSKSIKGVNNSVYFIDQNTGFVAGLYGLFLKTTNGGNDWILHNTGFNGSFYDLNFSLYPTGWLSGVVNSGMLKTTNGGDNWVSKAPAQSGSTERSYFINEQTGWFIGDKVLKTTNGGENWQSQIVMTGQLLKGIDFINENTGWICGGYLPGKIFKTTDGGQSWIEKLSMEFRNFNELKFYNDNTGYVFGSDTYRTSDGGETWSLINETAVTKVFHINGGTFYAIRTGSVLKTTDTCRSWEFQQLNTNASLFGIFFTDENHGWIGGNGVLMATTNGGLTSVKNNLLKIPESITLSQNYPNPFNPSTKINYKLQITSYVQLKVFDITGRFITSLVDAKQSAGSYEVEFNAADLPSGVYFYSLNVEGRQLDVKRMALVK